MQIEQAIFTSIQTDRAHGYQLVSRSGGVSEDEARELAVWGPSHDSLWEATNPSSTNFFRLASGKYCIARTTATAAEYSGRGGRSVYTQFLLVPLDVLRRFACNPFAVLRAARASGGLVEYETIPAALEPFTLGGRAPSVDLVLLAALRRTPGPAVMATLVQSALGSERLALSASTSCDQLIAGLFNLLPVECRCEFSFTSGLKPCESRPVRISTLGSDPSGWREGSRRGVTLLNLDSAELTLEGHWEGWAAAVAEILATGRLSLLAAELEQGRGDLSCDNLHLLGRQVQAQLAGGTARQVEARPTEAPPASKGRTASEPLAAASAFYQRGDAAHGAGAAEQPSSASAARETLGSNALLAAALAGQSPQVLELLERIDDLVFTAIRGDERALSELEILWPLAATELEENLLEQSREQYLRCALSIWTDCVATDVNRPERAVAAIDVLCVLFAE